ncbi:MAG: septum site-determining protein MinD [Cardiobacteriaceae bacterium]|nr:septum site-determining protein MinD [Cardiobacteriaceae bacterium]
MTKIIVVTSGKGGVGKTTTSVNIAVGFAKRGKKTCVVDFDVGLRNVDLLLGLERRVIYDSIQVIEKKARLNQALIHYNREGLGNDLLTMLATSQTSDKNALTKEGIEEIFNELKEMGYEYIICDSPAGIEHGAEMAMYFADEAVIVVNPEISSIRDSDRIVGIIDSKTKRSEMGLPPMPKHLVITRYHPERVEAGELMGTDQILRVLALKLQGIIPESPDAVVSSNQGIPMALNPSSEAGQAYLDFVDRLMGDDNLPFRFIEPQPLSIWKRLLGLGK